MSTYPFGYEVVLYIDKGEFITECGVGLAHSFADAARIIEEKYDPDLCVIKNLELLEDDTTIIVSKEVKDKIIKDEYINDTIHCDAHGDIVDPVEEFINDFINDTDRGKACEPADKAYEDWGCIEATPVVNESKRKVDSL